MQWVVQDEKRAPFLLATVVLDALVQEGAKRTGPRVVETHHRHSKQEAQDACHSANGRKQGSQGSKPVSGLPPSVSCALLLTFPPPTSRAETPLIRITWVHSFMC